MLPPEAPYREGDEPDQDDQEASDDRQECLDDEDFLSRPENTIEGVHGILYCRTEFTVISFG